MPTSGVPPLDHLTKWLEAPGRSRALVLEDGSAGSESPLARWLEGVRAAGEHEVISVSVGPGLISARDILARLDVALHPDDESDAATGGLLGLRESVRWGLRADEPRSPRIVALDRVGWAEPSFVDDLAHLLDRLHPEQKCVISVRAEEGSDLDVAAWLGRLGWRADEALVVRVPALLDETGLTPSERARGWMDVVKGEGPASRVLDVLATVARELSLEELSAITDLPTDKVESALREVPEGAVSEREAGRFAIHDPTSARAWLSLRGEAGAWPNERLLALGESALHGAATGVVPYVIQHHGGLHGARDLAAQIALVSEGWARAWSPLRDPLGFEADVARGWLAAERELSANVSSSAASRLPALLAIFRCKHASDAVIARVKEAAGGASIELASGTGSLSRDHARNLLKLSEGLAEPDKTRLFAIACDALLATDLTVNESDLLTRIAPRFEGERRAAITAKVLATLRAEVADWASGVWLLRAAPLLGEPERAALCDEVLASLTELPAHDAGPLTEALDAAPRDVAARLARARSALPREDRLRFGCALAAHLDGDERDEVIEELLAEADADPFPLGPGDVRSLARALDAAALVRLGAALKKLDYGDDLVGICLRALAARGDPRAAESLAGALSAAPLDWILALAAGSKDPRPDLAAELARRLSAMEHVRLAWTLDRDASELVRVLGIEPLLRLARAIAPDEERIVARIALVPFASELDKRALVREAAEIFRTSTAGGDLHWCDLLSCWRWMETADACHLAAHGSHEMDGLWALDDLTVFSSHLAGPEAPLRIADQLLELTRWLR